MLEEPVYYPMGWDKSREVMLIPTSKNSQAKSGLLIEIIVNQGS